MPTMLGLTNGGGRSASQSSSDQDDEPKKKPLNTISRRNHADALNMETLLWRAICDDPRSAGEYIADDCVMLNPVSFGTEDMMESKEDIMKQLKHSERWAGFKIGDDKQVVEAGLMAVTNLYRIALFRQTRKGPEQVDALVHSCWRQNAGADWHLVSHLVAYAD
ncbi:hypothetical protein PpBr36_04196 [Pyricularia pennisetigena]|uniref:hypothetical protein n=1 Tax=Pyricularia pennisetigena TaxID=1578925 RepID=UPI00114E3AC4|nr:hypothetical protein PpBr36_04196 [Pyricularia pennisetigena]TLS26590.1 hypothetical protein PpBr36_04196 [Pyricularia pennisetigena]